ncbi:MAG TPA: hypothetical protein VK586_16005, partial [Streptosporangiaceae bacterium]|nr:hypothetical protein [Streptosporangiaceae bacterium]
AKDKDASAAFARFRRQVDDTSKSVDKSSASLDKNAQSLDKNKQHATSALGALIGVGTAFAPITAGTAAAGLGFSAFAALAVPSILKVTTALSSKGGGLAAQWATLDNRQRVAAVGVQALMDRYTGLARAMEPQVFQVFASALGLANSLLGPTAKLAQAAGTGIESFLVQFSQRAGLQQFIADMAGIAGPSFALLGDDITHIAHAVFQLLQAFSGTGLVELRLLSGVFTALDDSITFLSQHAPALTSVAISIGGVALALSKLGLLSGALKITGIASIAGQMEGFAAATKGATLAEKGMLAATTALDAISPAGWAILATAAVGGLAFSLRNVQSGIEITIDSMAAQDRATGFNVAGYLKLAAQLEATAAHFHDVQGGAGLVGKALGDATTQEGAYTAAQQKVVTEGGNLLSFLGTLEQEYGLTQQQAITLAGHSGVLASQVAKGGTAMQDATAKAEAYANSNLNAQQPTTQLAKDVSDFANSTLGAVTQTKALTAALNVFFNPALTADQALITLAGDADTAAAALKASGGQTTALTGKQGAARSAFDTYIGQVAATASQVFAATGKTTDYNRIIDTNIPKLQSMAAGNKTLQALIQDLINTENRIPKTETTHIIVHGDGTYSVAGNAVKARAAGGLITGGTPGRDSVLSWLMPGEVVVPVPDVNAGAVDHLRGKLPGFAAGGVVGSYHDGIPGLTKWLSSENSATIRVIETATAAAAAAAMKAAVKAAAGPSSGGGHVNWT